jgi:hypothetical protein
VPSFLESTGITSEIEFFIWWRPKTYNAIARYIRPEIKVLNAIRLRGVFDFLYPFTWNIIMRY